MPRITVFTPTYKRAHLIDRVFISLQRQTCKDFEWIVIDDGSNDNTSDVIASFEAVADFDIIFISMNRNIGKVACVNHALDVSSGELFIVFDSDDWCKENTIETIITEWFSLPVERRSSYSGISCLKCYTNMTVVGEDYGRMVGGRLTYIDRYDRRIRGDKWEIIRTDVHRKYRYDLAPGERYMAPSYAWLGIGTSYATIFLNIALSIVEYQPDGISAHNLTHRIKSPISAGRFYTRALKLSNTRRGMLRAAINQVRFHLHSGRQGPLTLAHPLVIVGLIPGACAFIWDRVGRIRRFDPLGRR